MRHCYTAQHGMQPICFAGARKRLMPTVRCSKIYAFLDIIIIDQNQEIKSAGSSSEYFTKPKDHAACIGESAADRHGNRFTFIHSVAKT
jgi:hypothetical protein